MATLIKAPNRWKHDKFSIFLAGTIDNGKAVDWQSQIAHKFYKYDINLISPRREVWNPNVTQSINDPEFSEQVNWELDSLDRVDLIVMNILGDSLSPISLLEFGLFVRSKKIIIACEKNYWRRGNIEVVCDRNGLKLYDSFDELLPNIEIGNANKY